MPTGEVADRVGIQPVPAAHGDYTDWAGHTRCPGMADSSGGEKN